MKFEIAEIFDLLDKRENQQQPIILPRTKKPLLVNREKNKILNRFYINSKTEEIKCVCCGIKPTYISYNRSNGLLLRINETNYMTLDHIIPKSKGGTTSYYNLQMMCCKCNQKKADKIDLSDLTKIKFDLNIVFDALINKYNQLKKDLYELKRKILKNYPRIIKYETFCREIFIHIKHIVKKAQVLKLRGIMYA